MDKERLERIGKFLEVRMVIHRNVEHDSPWTTEEKMIQELYDNYLDLLIECGKQKEVIDKAIELINRMDKECEEEGCSFVNLIEVIKIKDVLKEVSE